MIAAQLLLLQDKRTNPKEMQKSIGRLVVFELQ